MLKFSNARPSRTLTANGSTPAQMLSRSAGSGKATSSERGEMAKSRRMRGLVVARAAERVAAGSSAAFSSPPSAPSDRDPGSASIS